MAGVKKSIEMVFDVGEGGGGGGRGEAIQNKIDLSMPWLTIIARHDCHVYHDMILSKSYKIPCHDLTKILT